MIRRLTTALIPLCAALPLALPAPAPSPTPVPGPANVVLTMKRFLAAVDSGETEAAAALLAVPPTVGYAMRLDGDEEFADFRKTPMGAWFDVDLAARPECYGSPQAFATALTTLPVSTEVRHEVRQGIAHCASHEASMGVLEFDRVILRAGEEVKRRRMRVTSILHWADGGFRIHSWHASELDGELPVPPMPAKATKKDG